VWRPLCVGGDCEVAWMANGSNLEVVTCTKFKTSGQALGHHFSGILIRSFAGWSVLSLGPFRHVHPIATPYSGYVRTAFLCNSPFSYRIFHHPSLETWLCLKSGGCRLRTHHHGIGHVTFPI